MKKIVNSIMTAALLICNLAEGASDAPVIRYHLNTRIKGSFDPVQQVIEFTENDVTDDTELAANISAGLKCVSSDPAAAIMPDEDPLLDVHASLACNEHRNEMGDAAYEQFCGCVVDSSSSTPGAIFSKMSQDDFATIEANAMKAAVALKLNEVRAKLRGISRTLTYSAFTPDLRPMILDASVPGSVCLPGRIGDYIESLKTSGKCNPKAMERLNDGVSTLMNINKRVNPDAMTFESGPNKNFGKFLDEYYADMFLKNTGLVNADSSIILDPHITEHISYTDTIAPSLADPVQGLPEDHTHTDANRFASKEHRNNLAGILKQALSNIRHGHPPGITGTDFELLKTNGIIANLVTDENDNVSPTLLATFFENFAHELKISDADLANPDVEPFNKKMKTYMESKVRENLGSCRINVMEPLEKEICPLIGEEKFSISSLLKVLKTPAERSAYAEIMREVSGHSRESNLSAKAVFQTDQMLCYTYGQSSVSNNIFSYTTGAPISPASVVFAPPTQEEALASYDNEYTNPTQEAYTERSIIRGARSRGDRVRSGDPLLSGSVHYNAEGVRTITSQYQNGKNPTGGSKNNDSTENKKPVAKEEAPRETPFGNIPNQGAATTNTNTSTYNVTSNLSGNTLLPLGGGASGGNGTDSDSSKAGASGDAAQVDYAARIAELQSMVEERERRLRETLAQQDRTVGDSLVSAANDRQAEIDALRKEIEGLKKDIASNRKVAAANGVVIPAAAAVTVAAPAAPSQGGPVLGATVKGSAGGTTVVPSLAPSGTSTNTGGGTFGPTDSTGSNLAGYDLYSSLGFVSNFSGMELTLNGTSFAPSRGQLVIPRSDFDGANEARKLQIYALANGSPIYVVNTDGSVTIFVAQNDSEGDLVYVAEGSSPVIGKPKKKKAAGRSIASEGAPVVAPTPAPPARRVRHSELLNLIGQ